MRHLSSGMTRTQIDWTAAERRQLESAGTRRFAGMLPGGVHVRPVDLTHGDELYLIWTFETAPRPYVWPPEFDSHYAEVVLRGFARMIPGRRRTSPGSDAECRRRILLQDAGEPSARSARSRSKARNRRRAVRHGRDVVACVRRVARRTRRGAAMPDYARWFLPSRYDDLRIAFSSSGWGPLVGQL